MIRAPREVRNYGSGTVWTAMWALEGKIGLMLSQFKYSDSQSVCEHASFNSLLQCRKGVSRSLI